jgi:DNA (cytosine-5)-methyltransferase 3A
MNVLSLCDGMRCGRIALERAGIKVDRYFASEIDKYAMAVGDINYPDTINLGDITKVTGHEIGDIDLLIGGFPCQSFSLAGKQLNFNDPKGKIFFECVRLLKVVQPKYFLFENVPMKKEYQEAITKAFIDAYYPSDEWELIEE